MGQGLSDKDIKDFEFLGIEDQLSKFNKVFPVDERWIDQFVALNKVTNCLTHRAGIVGQQDIGDTNELLVKWFSVVYSNTIAQPLDFNQLQEHLTGLIHLEPTGDLSITPELDYKKKCFSNGQKLQFDPDEILGRMQGLHIAATIF